ncbi:MAG: hypothetical protein CBC22_04370 [Alphaproteobacteria bacterium TMED62]|nr:MAG: hypothetical protein CBC22_04370 [Alphaproteobacteria bacterium TMED62]|tara:strand:+ start:10138 stop:11313 length:1176 start_codon:yes stop_codon:yes gene_type:complete
MRKNMAPKTKKKKILKIVKRKTINKQKININKGFTDLLKKFSTVVKVIYSFINLIIGNMIKFLKYLCALLLNLIKKIVKFLSGVKEAFFSILFGLLAGGIGAVIIFSYFDLNTQGITTEYESKILDGEKIIFQLKSEINKSNIRFEKFQSTLNELKSRLDAAEKNNLNNENIISEYNNKIEELFNITNANNQKIETSDKVSKNKISELEKIIENTSKLMLSSSKSELSNRLYLAKSLVDRLKAGVPYSPQLVALGQEGLDPALLRFAKGGAPTLSDLAARLSARAGELRDSLKTKSDLTWKDSLKDEISKLVKIKPTNSEDIEGMEGVLLRAEEAITKGDLEKAIAEINSLEVSARGVLDVWLKEAKAKKDAKVAAENILAKTTAALNIKN